MSLTFDWFDHPDDAVCKEADDNGNEKYITFHRKDFLRWWSSSTKGRAVGITEIGDAVVIRRQDKFAASALWNYAHSALLVSELLIDNGLDDEGKKLAGIADYFSQQAHFSSIDADTKLPD